MQSTAPTASKLVAPARDLGIRAFRHSGINIPDRESCSQVGRIWLPVTAEFSMGVWSSKGPVVLRLSKVQWKAGVTRTSAKTLSVADQHH